jgi:hypothetical protein
VSLPVAVRPGAALQENASVDLVVISVTAGAEEPVEGALVEFVDLGRAGLTDQNGRAAFRRLPVGPHRFVVRHIGFEEREGVLEISSGSEREYRVQVEPRAIAVEPLTVTVTGRDPYLVQAGFYDRAASIDPGYFATLEEIEHYQTFETLFKFQRELTVRYHRPLVVLLNGTPASRRGYRSPRDLDEFDFGAVRGIEAYACADAPPEIMKWIPIEMGLTRCNVIAIWTR